jgi:hypothetical protein
LRCYDRIVGRVVGIELVEDVVISWACSRGGVWKVQIGTPDNGVTVRAIDVEEAAAVHWHEKGSGLHRGPVVDRQRLDAAAL